MKWTHDCIIKAVYLVSDVCGQLSFSPLVYKIYNGFIIVVFVYGSSKLLNVTFVVFFIMVSVLVLLLQSVNLCQRMPNHNDCR